MVNKITRSIAFGLILCVTFFLHDSVNAQVLDLVKVNKNFQRQPLYVLQYHSVQTDEQLDLQDLQKTEISKLFTQMNNEKRRKGADFNDLPRIRRRELKKEHDQELHDLAIEYTRKLTEVLTPEQDARLLQLCLWKMIGGNYVLMFQDPSVQKLLRLRRSVVKDVETRLKEFASSNKKLLKERTERHLEEIMSLFSDEQREQVEQAVNGKGSGLNVKDFVGIEFGKGFYSDFEVQEIRRSHPKMNELKKRTFELHGRVSKAKDDAEELAALNGECRTFMTETFSPTLRTEIGDERYSKMRWEYLKRATASYVLAAGPPNEELVVELEISDVQMRAFESAHSGFKERLAKECEVINERQFEEIFSLMDDEEMELFSTLFGERPDFDLYVWSVISGGY